MDNVSEQLEKIVEVNDNISSLLKKTNLAFPQLQDNFDVYIKQLAKPTAAAAAKTTAHKPSKRVKDIKT